MTDNILPFQQQKFEAIILAGGLGTRLKSAVPNLPKCMAPVAGHPFLYYVINNLRNQGVQKLIFSLGYKHEIIVDYLNREFPALDYEMVIETEPLGTGGAIHFALQKTSVQNVFIANGDTLYTCNLKAMWQHHQSTNAHCTLALKPMAFFDRYGAVEVNDKNIITGFTEKSYYKSGLINGGIYLLNKTSFLTKEFPGEFSFEKEYLEKFVFEENFSAIINDNYFIDIGIPEDFEKAGLELKRPPLNLSDIDKTWTLFLDRDGVINHDKVGSYVFNKDEFEFTKGAPGLFQNLTKKFKRIIVVTNQRGVGRGLMTADDLEGIHTKMIYAIEEANGTIENIYFTNDIDSTSFMRKPNPGMALRILQDYPDTDFLKSVMVGNNISDLQFARSCGMHTVFVTTTIQDTSAFDQYIDLCFNDLLSFSEALSSV